VVVVMAQIEEEARRVRNGRFPSVVILAFLCDRRAAHTRERPEDCGNDSQAALHGLAPFPSKSDSNQVNADMLRRARSYRVSAAIGERDGCLEPGSRGSVNRQKRRSGRWIAAARCVRCSAAPARGFVDRQCGKPAAACPDGSMVGFRAAVVNFRD
jgi:hypothetical protein